jgi:pimeloyl-ACP methyl ester carboxylesterase
MMAALLLAVAVLDTAAIRDLRVGPGEVVRVTSVGTGPAVVFLPNLFGSAFGFRQLTAPLAADGYRAMVIEPLGTGFSSYPKQADYSLTAQADRVAAALDSLGVRGALVVGHGVGASIALRLAYRHPELVGGIVAIDGGPIETAATPGLRRATASGPLLQLLMSASALRRRVRHYLVENSGDPTWVTADVVEHYTAGPERNLSAMIDAWDGMVTAREPEQLRDHMAEIRAPVRLLVGRIAHPSGVQPAEITQLRDALPDFAIDSVSGAGGLIHEEQPAAVLQAIGALEHTPAFARASANASN